MLSFRGGINLKEHGSLPAIMGDVSYFDKVLGTSPLVCLPLSETSGTDAFDATPNGHDAEYSADVSGWTPRDDVLGLSFPDNGGNKHVDLFPAGESLSTALDMAEISVLFIIKLVNNAGSRRLFEIYTDAQNYLRVVINYTTVLLSCDYEAGNVIRDCDHNSIAYVGQWLRFLTVISASGDSMKTYLGSQQIDAEQTGLGTWVGTPTGARVFATHAGLNICSGPGGLFTIWDRALSDADITTVLSDGGDLYSP